EAPMGGPRRGARAAGRVVFHDGTCRPERVKNFRPLGISFNEFEKDTPPAADDAAYWRFPRYCRAHVPALKKALDAVAAPPAAVDNDEVFLSERRAEDSRYLLAVNNTTPDLGPGQLWRTTLFVASRVPVQAPVRLGAESRFVYDVFAMKRVEPRDGVVDADCRSLLARIYALLPAAIDHLAVRGPESVR